MMDPDTVGVAAVADEPPAQMRRDRQEQIADAKQVTIKIGILVETGAGVDAVEVDNDAAADRAGFTQERGRASGQAEMTMNDVERRKIEQAIRPMQQRQGPGFLLVARV